MNNKFPLARETDAEMDRRDQVGLTDVFKAPQGA